MFHSARVLILAGLTLLAQGRVHLDDLREYTFERFVTEFRHPWRQGTEEYATRRAIFQEELKSVLAHNAGSNTWKVSINKYSAMTAAEKKALNGYSKSVDVAHKPKYGKALPSDFVLKPVESLPKSVDWRQSGVVTSVKDQGHCGSCWAFASTAVLESHLAINTGLLYDLSPQQIAFCAPNPDSCGGTGGCNGATSEIAFDYVAGAGMLEEYQLGYQAYYGQASACGFNEATVPVGTIDGYVYLPENNYTTLMNAIATVGPIAVSVDASTWHSYDSGIFSGCNQVNPVINHAVVLVGYGEEENGDKYWIVRNSWSPSWGENGYIRVARANNEQEICGTDLYPQDGSACAGDTEPVKVCGTCGILYDSSYPTNAKH